MWTKLPNCRFKLTDLFVFKIGKISNSLNKCLYAAIPQKNKLKILKLFGIGQLLNYFRIFTSWLKEHNAFVCPPAYIFLLITQRLIDLRSAPHQLQTKGKTSEGILALSCNPKEAQKTLRTVLGEKLPSPAVSCRGKG